MRQQTPSGAPAVRALQTLLQPFRQSLAGNAAMLASSQYFAAGVGLLTTVIATRILGPHDFGRAALVIAYPALWWAFASFKPISVLTRYLADFRESRREEEFKSVCKLGFLIDFATSLIVVVGLLGTAGWIAGSFYGMAELAPLIRLYAAAIPFYALMGTSQAILTAARRFKLMAALTVLETAVTFVLIIGFLLSGRGIYGFVLGTALGQVIAGAALFLAANWVLMREGFAGWLGAPFHRIESLRADLTQALGWNYVMISAAGVLQQAPLMFLGTLRGAAEAGFYRLATSIVTVGSYLESSLSAVAYPQLSSGELKNSAEKTRIQVLEWTRQQGAVAALVLILPVPFLPVLLPAVFSGQFAPMVRGAQWMMLAVVLSTLFFWLHAFYYASGKVRILSRAFSMMVLLVLAGGWALAPRLGFTGVAIAFAVGKLVFTISMAMPALSRLRREVA